MSRKVFFSFHFDRDSWRVGQVRNSNVVKKEFEPSPFLDWAEWQSIQTKGKAAIQKWIDDQLTGSGVTVVLIGKETYTREFVLYEIKKSYSENKGLLGVYIHNIKNQKQETDTRGKNPFDLVNDRDGRPLSNTVPTYDWIDDDGRNNLGRWIEAAAKKVNR